jgi:hypothetical protein
MKQEETSPITAVVTSVEEQVADLEQRFEQVAQPVRRSVFYRFPILFTLLVAFGFTTTLVGFELVLAEWSYVYERPWLVLLLGLSILVLTGTLYKKLR